MAVLAAIVLGVVTGAWSLFVIAAAWLLMLALTLHTTRRGKFVVWAELLDRLGLRGDERILDLGCGRGAVLVLAAQRVPRGEVVGVDLWRGRDQSGNDPEATRHNAAAAGVAERVSLVTANMTGLPFDAASFDLVVSSLAIHNIHASGGRDAALAEAARVLRPGGRMLIVDLPAARAYPARLRELGLADVSATRLGWRMWWGGPWVASTLVRATRSSPG